MLAIARFEVMWGPHPFDGVAELIYVVVTARKTGDEEPE